MTLTVDDAHTLLAGRLADLRDDWTDDQPLPSGQIERGSLAFPLHQMLVHADPGLHLLRETAYQVDFRLPLLGKNWQVTIDTMRTGSWQIRMDDRTQNGYAFTGRANTLADLADLLARCRNRIVELANMTVDERSAASTI